MTYSTALRSAVCTAALIAGSAAHADLTAAQVWEDWKSQLEVYGSQNLSIGAEETSSGTVTVRDIVISFEDTEANVKASIGDIFFNEQSDGSVRITMEDSFPVIVTGSDGVVLTINMTQRNLEMNVSGTADLMEYDVSADSYEIAFQDVVDADVTITGDAKLTATGLDASYTVAIGDMREISATSSIDTIDLLVDFQIPGGDGEYVTAAAKINDMRSQSETIMPLEADMTNPDDIFVNGFGLAGGYIIDSADYVFDINAEGDQASGSISTGSVTLTGEMNNETVGYDSETVDIAVNFLTSDFPLPIEMSMAEYGTGFQMPVGVTDAPADFGFKLNMIDLVLGDAIWGLFDPNEVLPRDPATLQMAFSGKAQALYDFFDPAQEDRMMSGENPLELYNVSLDRLKIMAAGALFTGTGAFTFDNDDKQSFAPMPRPEGEASFEITGLNALLDNLVAMGLVPEQDIMGPRMMMGMFARSTGDDQMAIDVEVTSNGQVNVNGNRVR